MSHDAGKCCETCFGRCKVLTYLIFLPGQGKAEKFKAGMVSCGRYSLGRGFHKQIPWNNSIWEAKVKSIAFGGS